MRLSVREYEREWGEVIVVVGVEREDLRRCES